MIQAISVPKAAIGESPLWDPRAGCIYWTDIKAPALYRFEPATGVTNHWLVTSDLGAFALTGDAGAVVALREGVQRLDLKTGRLTPLSPAPFDPRRFRFNGGICDDTGRFWIGVMFDPLDGSQQRQPASLYSFTLAGGLREEPDRSCLHNGFAWSRDGDQLFLSHSWEQTIYCYDVAGGRLGKRRVFATVPESNGLPDGGAVDAEGCYWCALHGGGRLRRFRPDGSVDRDVELPVSLPTMPAFAGAALDRLYVTSASDQMSKAQRQREPLAGGMLRLDPCVSGLAKPFLVR